MQTDQQTSTFPDFPVFDADGTWTRSPGALPDDFIKFLFDGSQFTPSDTTDHFNINDFSMTALENSFAVDGGIWNDSNPMGSLFLPTPRSSTPIPATDGNTVSPGRCKHVHEYIIRICHDVTKPDIAFVNSLVQGDPVRGSHPLHSHKVQFYIDDYWLHCDPQLPILHKPTFSPDTTSDQLLVAIIILEASCRSDNDESNELAACLAWHLRWDIFATMYSEHDGLEIYQALCLLETYEKLRGSRLLHERAHIHHATLITLLRRTHMLIERSSTSPPSVDTDWTRDTGMPTDTWWKAWIRSEATRRLAFAAFVIDSSHAAMFGHSMIMTTNELRLLLPCRSALWNSSNPGEALIMEELSNAEPTNRLTFAQSLRRSLGGNEIQCELFTKGILLCGLMSLGWHMNQRDLQLSSLRLSTKEGQKELRWRHLITKAYHHWIGSLSLQANSEASIAAAAHSVLFPIAELSLYADIVDCQIFAGSKRVMGRSISHHDFHNADNRIRNLWAPSQEARKATFCAIKLLVSILLIPCGTDVDCDLGIFSSLPSLIGTLSTHLWVLYTAALVVWTYSFVVDGPMLGPPQLEGLPAQISSMRAFLKRMSTMQSYDDLQYFRLNSCASTLTVIAHILRQARWELLHEGANHLDRCTSKIWKQEGS
ncbi:Fungal specific transcription factor domain-containing protein 5 [Elsinoe fawcettii]|nr:Fungal specific transcription factor domain-containing protein 5 [Elsinoe fawcettii]